MDVCNKPEFSNLFELLQHRSQSDAGNDAFTFLGDGEQVSGKLTFAQLWQQAKTIAAHLQAHATAGDRVLLVYGPSLEYIVGFFACMLAGMTAVPAVPPTNVRMLRRLQLIADDSQPRLVLASSDIAQRARQLGDGAALSLNALTWLASDTLDAGAPAWTAPTPGSADIAFLQYTSGSTGSPKGVKVSHGNIIANCRLIHSAFAIEPTETLVSWLPPHHDMGLIGMILYPVYAGGHCIQFSPAAFMMRPHRWLQAMSQYKARGTAAPNFAYELCVEKVDAERRKSLDLSSVKYMLNGAEPIRPGTIARFNAAFADCGLNPQAVTPVYGLAESTLMVSHTRHHDEGLLQRTVRISKQALANDLVADAAGEVDSVELVSVGPSASGATTVVVVDPTSMTVCDAGRVGEVWVHGPSVAHGYWNRPEETALAFGARIAGSDERYLRTGDLGFVAQGELYITGRSKEMLIFSGRNIYPQDIEATIEALDPAFRANGCAAFALEVDGVSQLGIVQEVESRKQANVDSLLKAVRVALAEEHGIMQVAAVVLVKAGHLPRTSSGKIQRVLCKDMLLANQFGALWEWRSAPAGIASDAPAAEHVEPRSLAERQLAASWSELFGLDRISIHANFFDLGGDSMLAVRLISRLRESFGVEVSASQLFDAPTVAQLAELIQGMVAVDQLPLLPIGRGGKLQLSFPQQRLWFLHQVEPDSAAYNLAATMRLSGVLDVDGVHASFRQLLQRHEALRTTFVSEDGAAVQIIAQDMDIALPFIDLSNMELAAQNEQVRRLSEADAAKPFDLAAGPLLRLALCKLAGEEHVLLVTMHHIVSDGWSMRVMLREFLAGYEAHVQRRAPALPPLPVQYADYAQWQRQWLGAELLEKQLEYWKQRLGDQHPVLELPADRPRPAVQSYRGAKHHAILPAALTAKLHQLGRQQGTTLFMTLLAAFQLLLARLSGQDDIRVGVPIAGRNRVELEGLIGFFVNTQVLRSVVDGRQGFTELLRQVREAALGAQEHQDLPFEQLVEALQPERSRNHSPLCQVKFVLQQRWAESAGLAGLKVEVDAVDEGQARFDLALDVTEIDGELACMFNYATDLFDAATIARWADHWKTLLTALVEAPQLPVAELPLLSQAERDRMQQLWQGPRSELVFEPVHARIAAHARRRPDATALRAEDATLTYAELDGQANRIAQYLAEQGIGPESRVAVCLPRSPEMVVAIFGTLKAGAAYVPLDPKWPAERLNYQLNDSGARLVVGASSLGMPVCLQNHGAARYLDLSGPELANMSETAVPERSTAQHAAYVIYTSGSTGQPKGVVLSHGAFANYLSAVSDQLPLAGIASMAFVSTVAADLGHTVLFGALANGCALHLISEERAFDPDSFGEYMAAHRIDALKIVPSHLTGLLQAAAPQQVLPQRCLVLGGEASSWTLVDTIERLAPGCRIINHYGPTETTVGVLTHAHDRARRSSARILPLGRPLANNRVCVLDAEFNPVPEGVPGEVYIGGAQLARGYLDRPDLTAERFIPDPFCAAHGAGARLYRTGDLARILPDGNLEYLGRQDDQVKVRGYRVEPGEIAAQLKAEPGVADAVVVLDTAGDQARLVGYVVAPASQDLPALQESLAKRLPDYMVPALLVRLDKMPLTPNGKLDRKALPQADVVKTETFVAPRNDTETTLAGIWQAALKLDRVGVHDNFFALGGDSIRSLLVIARARAKGIKLLPKQLFDHQTIAALAQMLDAGSPRVPGSLPIQPVARDGNLPLSFSQQRMWFHHRMDPDSAAYNVPALLRFSGELDVAAMKGAFDALLARHEVLRTTFREIDGVAVQEIATQAQVALPVIDLTALQGDAQAAEVRRLATEDAVRPFDLSGGPLLRLMLLKLGETEHVLLLALHHIVSDGWSLAVLVREFTALYVACRDDLPHSLPPLPVQYADFAHWQRATLTGPALEAELAYWQAQLGGPQPVLELPTDRPRPPVARAHGAKHHFTLDARLSSALRQLSHDQGATLFMTLKAAFDALLFRLSGQADIRVGVPIAGRNRVELEGLIGFFVNTQVLRSVIDGSQGFTELLRQVREAALGAQEHQDLPFEQLVDALQPERSLSHSPLCQVKFVLQQRWTDLSALNLAGLKVELDAADDGAARFDLALDVTEIDGELACMFNYATDLFDAATIARWADHWKTLLTALLEAPQMPVAELPLLSLAERDRMQQLWQGPRNELVFESVHARIAAHARRRPDATALRAEDATLTYAELDGQSNRIAQYLAEQGIAPESRVAVCLPRSPEMVVAILGILKAGGAYVPLDPKWPAERLNYQLNDSGARLVIGASSLGMPVCLQNHGAARYLDLSGPELANMSETAVPERSTAQHAAYVIYTSGSTGQPKGVVLSHGAFANYLSAVSDQLPLAGIASMAFVSTVAADLGHTVLFGALANGCALHLISEERAFDPDSFGEYMAAHRVDALKIVPSHLTGLLQAAAPQQVLPQRCLVLGGEASSWTLVDTIERLAPDCRIINHYGPTETTVGVLTHAHDRARRSSARILPLGRPLANNRVCVLDAEFNPVPEGVPGEVYIGGAQLARGYLDRPDLTAERFIPDPFCAAHGAGARLYRTGDLARILPDGNLEYLGRQDDQVKVRGYRVEPGEIAAQLKAEPGVADAVVVLETTDERARLVGYVVAPASQDLPALQKSLAKRLPDYMVPALLVRLDKLPLTPNGKLDRRALPQPESNASGTSQVAEPRNEIEARLAAVWQDVLKLERVGIHDSFFSIGGDSILLLQVISRARAQGLKLTPKQMYEGPTIAQAAQVAVPVAGKSKASTGEIAGDVLLTPIQSWFFGQQLAAPHHWNQAVLLTATGALDGASLRIALQSLLRHHAALRLRFIDGGGKVRQTHAPDGSPVFMQTIDLAEASEAEQERAIAEACSRIQASLDIARGPLLAAAHLRLASGGERLLIAIHHLAVDGVSWRILLEDLRTAYQQLAAGQPVALPAKTTSWQAWSEKLHSYAQGAPLQSELGYWTAAVKPMALPCIDPQGENNVGIARQFALRLSAEETQQLLQRVPAAYRTQINDILLTALTQTLCRWSNGMHALIELEGHGREDLFDDVDLSRTVGWFTTRFPVCLAAGHEPATAIKAVKEQLRAIPHKGIGFGLLKYLGSPEARAALDALPRPQVSFNYLGQFEQVHGQDVFNLATEGAGPSRAAANRRSHWLDVGSHITEGAMVVTWTYSPAVHAVADIEQLAHDYVADLRRLIAHCVTAEGGATPSDFPLAAIAQPELERLPVKAIEDIYPLTPMQKGMLFHSLNTPDNDVYVNQSHGTLSGRLDIDVFRSAWQDAIRAHEILRTSFLHEREGEALQIVWREAVLPFTVLDWSKLSPEQHAERLATLLEQDRTEGFDLAQVPLMRIALIARHDGATEFVWTKHHLLLDGWSSTRLINEVLSRYFAVVDGDSALLKAEANCGRYRDYVEWVGKQGEETAQRFWAESLAGLSEPLRLADVVVRPREPKAGHGNQVYLLSASLSGALQQFAQGQQVTINTVLQAAWSLLLSRYSGRNDVIFGVTVSGRSADLAGIENMLGLLINTLPLYRRIDPAQRIGDWLQDLQRANADLRQFETTSLADIQRWSKLGGVSSLFDTLLVFENYPVDAGLRQKGMRLEIDGMRAHKANNYPLTLAAVPGERLRLTFMYDRAYFGDADVERLQTHLGNILQGMLDHVDSRIEAVPLLSQAERDRMQQLWQGPRNELAFEPVHARIAAHARRRPDATALRAEDATLTYAELDGQANRIAQYLAEQGIGPESRVAVCLPRSPEMVVAILGILKAGAAYVPLDPKWPAERLNYQLNDSGARLVIGASSLGMPVCLQNHGAARYLDLSGPELAHMSDAAVPERSTAQHAAYVIYTSGSTGQPKGVVLSHGAFANYLSAVSDQLPLAGIASMAFVSTVAADLGHTVLFGALANGCALHLISEERAFDPDSFGEYMAAHRVDALKIVPSHLTGLLQAAAPQQVLPQRCLVLGGEASSWTLVDTIERLAPDCRIINHYGPTETTVGVLTHAHDRARRSSARILPLGRPLANNRVCVLDAEFNPVPEGVPGEVYIGGAQLARGYLDRPDLTAERFIPDPFCAAHGAGARLYRTGDMARILPDGNLEYLGRQDDQVKVRGYRVEPGEVAAQLKAEPGVADAAVVLDTSGDQARLVGYVVAPASQDLPALQESLAKRLPDYMVPALLVRLDKMPLTPNGKLDRKALPQADVVKTETFVAPRNDTETTLAGIWQAALKLDRVGVHDNFFALGGDSIRSLLVIARARAKGIKLLPKQVFDHPTIAELAQVLDAASQGTTASLPIQPVARDGNLPLSFSQQRMWFLYRMDPDSAAYNMPVMLRLSGELDVAALKGAFEVLLARHENLRTTFREVDGVAVQEIAAQANVALPVIDLTVLQGEAQAVEVQRLAAENAERPFDLSAGPMLRLMLLKLGDTEHVLLLAQHHIVTDGASLTVLVRELGALYAACRAGQPHNLPPMPIQYADFAHWQRATLTGATLKRELAYWRAQLGGPQPVLDLPTDRPRPAVARANGARYRFTLDAQLTSALRKLSLDQGVTLFMTLKAAFDALLFRWSGQADIRVGVPFTNRNRVELEGLMGFLVDTHVLRSQVDGRAGFTGLLKQVKEAALGAQEHQNFPFEQLVEALQPERDMSRSPLFQVMFNMLRDDSSTRSDIEGLRIQAQPFEKGATQFDLIANIKEDDEVLKASFTYRSDLFDAATMARLAASFGELLAAVVANPACPVNDLAVLDSAQRRQMLEGWNDTERSYPALCTHQLIEEQARATPERTALACGGAELSYAQLNARANQLAHYLRGQGVRPDSLVGIYLERSADMLVAVLGVLKSGAAYVPLDPAYPAERIAYMLGDAQPAIVLTQAALADQLPPGGHASLCLDRDWPFLAACATTDLPPAAAGANLAYVIYTSGSTGKPKGVGVSHASLANFLHSMREAPGIAQHDVLLAVTSLSFDIAGLELYLPLCAGATLVLCDRAAAADPQQLSALMVQQGVTMMQATPATWRMLLDHGWPELARPLKVLCGGEAITPELARQVLRHAGEMWNMYGPTETTIWSAARRLDADAERVLLGGPIANTGLYVLDPALNPVPVGVAGELHIGGAGLARGYLNRPDLTAEKFIPHPFSTEPGARLYKTGDLVRFLADGSIDFLGRIDNQVKLRGYRIELGEIEAALGEMAGISQAVVLAREDTAGDKRLVAYLVGQAPDQAMLRAGLLNRLPEYMVPSQFMVLDALPLTSNGKIDRKALPAPDLLGSELAYVAPRNPTEQTLADLLAEVLKREQVGIHDSFFALGGHSLQVLMMLSRIRKHFNIELEPRTLFEAPTIAGLAARIDLKTADAAGKAQAPAPAIARVSRDSRRAKLQGKELITDK